MPHPANPKFRPNISRRHPAGNQPRPRAAFPTRRFNFPPSSRLSRHSDFPSYRFFRRAGFSDIPIFSSYRLSRHTGFSDIPVFPSFRRKPESTPCDGLRFSPERRTHTILTFPSSRLSRHSEFFPSFRRKPESTRHDELRFSPAQRIHTIPIFRHSVLSVISDFPSLRRKPESTRYDRLRISPERRIPAIPAFPSFRFFRHSGASRNLHAALDSAFRRSDGSTPFRFSLHSVFSVISDFPSFRRKPESTRYNRLQLSPEQRTHTIPIFPSLRRKPESTRHDGLRFAPERRRACQTT